ncbi:phytase [Parapedobacter lycopersici]|uniref:phytase n=1 Tax=Parapedobacter lycopersici TaxID=1864939 RepID=UPI00214D6329|nr:phytase [Parapedobacter lycopersici]
MMNVKQTITGWTGAALAALSLVACQEGLAPVREDALTPAVITEPTPHDTDDPAIWINAADSSKSLIIGTDKDSDGGLYAYDLEGRIVNKVTGLQRPNNVDVAYGLAYGDTVIDIAVLTERETNKLRVFRLPDLAPVDAGGIPVFVDEAERAPMGIALYTRAADSAIFAIVGRKSGPKEGYLWQYRLEGTSGRVDAKLVRKFGTYSGEKEIEAIAVDNELGYVYYSDEGVGVRKYQADPERNDNGELALFALTGFADDHEGIAIYKSSDSTGYLLVSNQQANTFMVYPREGAAGKPHEHTQLADIPVSTVECDGADVTAVNLGPQFPEGVFVAMSNGMVFHYYDWAVFQQWIDKSNR